MTKFQNLKIAITPEQPLDEVVRELERLRYKKYRIDEDANIVLAKSLGTYACYRIPVHDTYNMITLTELKEME